MDRLDELAVFVAILDTGSLAAAARRLRRSPPAVTRALADAEARLGTRLIERTTRRLTPTEAGHRFGAAARLALAAYGDAVRQAADSTPRGLLRITAPLIFGRRHVTPVLAGFLDRFAAMRAELLLADRTLDLLEEGLDAALRIGPPADTLANPHRIGEVRRIVVAAPGYLAARGTPSVPADLAQHALVHAIGGPAPSEWRFRTGAREKSCGWRPACRSTRSRPHWSRCGPATASRACCPRPGCRRAGRRNTGASAARLRAAAAAGDPGHRRGRPAGARARLPRLRGAAVVGVASGAGGTGRPRWTPAGCRA